MFKFYVVCDENDPGSEHLTYEEARAVCVYWQQHGYPNAIIVW